MGEGWGKKSILFRCDNEAVVYIINTGTSRDPCLMCCLSFISAKYNLLLYATHIAGAVNGLADAISRNNLKFFLSNYPQSNPLGSTVPHNLIDLLPRLDVTVLEQHVQFYLQSALSESTMRSYSSGQWRYYDFCSRCNLIPLPTSEPVLCQFVSFLGTEKLKHKTIKSYFSSICFLQILQCSTEPFIRDMPRLTYVLRGLKSDEAKKDQRGRPRLPITPPLLTRL